jgi:hypothetical protein
VLLQGGTSPISLQRLQLGGGGDDGRRREAFIQDLIHERPEIIPMADIEPAFRPMIPICRELETDAGYVDNLWLTPTGGIVIGECKLVRNPQARREVLAQALDYARAISEWHYEDLEAAVRKALRNPQLTLWEFVEEDSDLDEAQFVDSIERHLVSSRFMVLIIGDGIQEGVESLTSYLQLHAGLHVGVALVDLSIWRGVQNELLIIPRIPLRTVLVERGIVVFDVEGNTRVLPPRVSVGRGPSSTPRPATLSEPEFYEQLARNRPELVDPIRTFVESLADLGIAPEFMRSMLLRWRMSPDVVGTLGYIDVQGRASLGSGWHTASRLGKPEAGEAYLEAVANMVGGAVRRYEKNWPEVVGRDGRYVEVATLLAVGPQWKDEMARLIAELRPEN